MTDEFEFADAYCALDGLPPAYCGGYPQAEGDHVVVVTRITHRLVGAQLNLEFDPGEGSPAVQVYLQEGWDEVDDMGDPYPIPARLAPTGGTITLKSAGFTAGAALLQGYTGFIYGGGLWAKHIHDGIAARLHAGGFASLAEAVGSGAVGPTG